MDDKDVVKQNSGPHQGNIHSDADEGRNEGKQGSTLDKRTHSEQAADEKDDNADSDGKQDEDTLGIP